jgi:hypothetical protein
MPTKLITIGPFNGRNGADAPIDLPDDQAVEMLNVDRWDGLIGRKRGGCDAVSTTGGSAFSLGIAALIRHVPGADETLAELWGVDGAGVIKRLAGGTTFVDLTYVNADSIANMVDTVGVSFNGKLYLFYNSTVDRPHVYDPGLSTPQVRRMGLAPASAAPTVANTGGGAYAATLRYYRVRFIQVTGANITRRSEASPSVAFTPSGAGTAARITRPTAPGEGETHWEVEASLDDSSFFRIVGTGGASSVVAIATTTTDDSLVTTTYSTYPLSPVVGSYTVPTSGKFGLTDGNRLIFGGSWEGGKNSRIYYTPVLGSTDVGDDERIPGTTNQKNYIDLNENDGGALTGLGGPLNGVVYAFKYRQIWRLMPTGDVNAPYLTKKIVDGIGCVAHKSIAMGEDEAGRPALYFMSHKGAYRLSANEFGSHNLQYLWRDNEDYALNLGATSVVTHSIYFPMKHQWWVWIATGSNNDPDSLFVFDPLLGEVDSRNRVRKGWVRFSGNLSGARCSTMMSNTLGATMSRDLKPYIGRSTGTTVLKADTSATDDAGTTFQAYAKSKPIRVAPLGTNAAVGMSHLLAEVASGVTITQTLDRDYGIETRTSTVLLTASASETRTLKKFEGSALAGAGTIQAQIGDASAVANSWVLDLVSMPVTVQEHR